MGQSLLILGPRGAGKSYYLKKVLEKELAVDLFIDLLDSNLYEKYLKTPSLLNSEISAIITEKNFIVIIDEIQLLPILFNEIHRSIEKWPNIRFVLTGSSARKLKKKEVNLLAGRALLISFSTFSLLELKVDKGFNLEEILQYGLLPKAYLQKEKMIKSKYLKTYTQVYLKEEVKQEALVRNLGSFINFLELAAFENGNPVNYSKLSKKIGVSDHTLKEYFQILEDTLITTKIPAWDYSYRKQLQKSPKYYYFDNGVLNALMGELGTISRSSSYRYGRLFENLLVNEIIKIIKLDDSEYKIYHYRTTKGKEIDLILQKNPFSLPIAIEIKSSLNPMKEDIKELISFQKDFPDAKCMVLANCSKKYMIGNITVYPLLAGLDFLKNNLSF